MSVERATHIGMGWMVSAQTKEKMCAAAGEALDEVEDHFLAVNNWSSDSDYFFGDLVHRVDEGEYIDFLDVNKCLETVIGTFSERYTRLIELCGEQISVGSKWTEPSVFVIHTVY